MQKKSQWESIVVTSSKPLTYFYERALKVAPSRDGKKPLTVKEVFKSINKGGNHE
tara:strand:- start:1823 stop:1987 length:165 start_codon:yes stop_codon:yes gene_type:complete